MRDGFCLLPRSVKQAKPAFDLPPEASGSVLEAGIGEHLSRVVLAGCQDRTFDVSPRQSEIIQQPIVQRRDFTQRLSVSIPPQPSVEGLDCRRNNCPTSRTKRR
jgi:hypothetical protein